MCNFPGIDAWPGRQIHSHNYRSPDPFRDLVGVNFLSLYIISSPEILSFWLYNLCSVLRTYYAQVVILIGSGSSALDMSLEIAQVANEVHIASRSSKVGVLGNLSSYDNLKLHLMTKVIISGIWLSRKSLERIIS